MEELGIEHISFEKLKLLITMGKLFHLLFLFVNLILMLNFVIAILSDTYGSLGAIKNGLYYDELVTAFPLQDWNDEYGALICAQPPFNVFLPFFIPTLLYKEKTSK